MSGQQGKLPEDSLERMMEQGAAGQDPTKNPLAQLQGNAGKLGGKATSPKNPLDMVTGLVDPNTWVRELYGLSEPVANTKEAEKKKDGHTPLDMKKVGSKAVTPDQRRFFKQYQEEYEQFLNQKKKQEQEKKQREEEDEKRKKEEMKKRQEQEDGGSANPQGKQKQKLGQPRRKATTELHPETKAGGAK